VPRHVLPLSIVALALVQHIVCVIFLLIWSVVDW
jgi:hypothetical protein